MCLSSRKFVMYLSTCVSSTLSSYFFTSCSSNFSPINAFTAVLAVSEVEKSSVWIGWPCCDAKSLTSRIVIGSPSTLATTRSTAGVFATIIWSAVSCCSTGAGGAGCTSGFDAKMEASGMPLPGASDAGTMRGSRDGFTAPSGSGGRGIGCDGCEGCDDATMRWWQRRRVHQSRRCRSGRGRCAIGRISRHRCGVDRILDEGVGLRFEKVDRAAGERARHRNTNRYRRSCHYHASRGGSRKRSPLLHQLTACPTFAAGQFSNFSQPASACKTPSSCANNCSYSAGSIRAITWNDGVSFIVRRF